jgi:hypothetical protein
MQAAERPDTALTGLMYADLKRYELAWRCLSVFDYDDLAPRLMYADKRLQGLGCWPAGDCSS